MDLNDAEIYKNTKEIEIKGCVSVPEDCAEDDFTNKFIDFVENNYWSFGGGIKILEKE